MGKEIPAKSMSEKPSLFKHLLQSNRNKGQGLIWMGLAGLLVIGWLVCLALVSENVNKARIRFAPADVVYGEKVHASHEMMMDSESNLPGIFPADTGARPEIQVSERFFDFGEVGVKQILKHTFVIANLGQAPLVILHAYTTCDCTVADFTAARIPPGKVALMALQFDAGYRNMHSMTVSRGVVIETNDPENPLQEIWIQATVK